MAGCEVPRIHNLPASSAACLDALPWSVTSYNTQTGQCTLTRGVTAKGSVDQFDVPQNGDGVTERVSVQGTIYVRDPALRAAALRRANGRCEFLSGPRLHYARWQDFS